MKIKSFIVLTWLLLFCSCAKEGPFTLGNLEAQIEISGITATSAIVHVTLPKSGNNVFKYLDNSYNKPSLYLISPSDYPTTPSWEDNYQRGLCFLINETECVALFDNLKPNIQYGVEINPKLDYNEVGFDQGFDYCSGVTFTTAQSGDYSELGIDMNITCELYHESENGIRVRFYLPQNENLKFDLRTLNFYESQSSDMTNPIICDYSDFDERDNTFWASFPKLSQSKYYFMVEGDFDIIYNISGKEVPISCKNVQIIVKNSLDI